MNTHIRWLIRRDLPDVLAIERASFDSPWTEEEFTRSLRQRNCIGMVADHDEKIVGFMLYELDRTNLHLLHFAVSPAFLRRGVGRAMVQKLVGKLHPKRRRKIVAEIRETNYGAQQFFSACGFRAVNILRDHYDDSEEDAYVFEFAIPREASTAANRINQYEI